MIGVLLVRHGPTAWNEAGLIQGRSDVPLSAQGRERVRSWRLPRGFADAACRVSPLRRAVETAELLGCAAPQIEPRLIEMAWGQLEGRSLAELRSSLGPAFAALERRGLDFTPCGGDSPRMVADRLGSLLADLAGAGRDAVLVTHKGVQRAALVLGAGWDMLGKPPVRLGADDALAVEIGEEGIVTRPRAIPLRA